MSGIKEGLVAIAGEVLADLQKETEAIIYKSEMEAKEKLEKAKVEAESMYAQVVGVAKEEIVASQRRAIALIEVEIRNHLLRVKESLVDDVFEGVKGRLDQFVVASAYYPFLLVLIEEAARKVSGKSLVVFVNSKDGEWLLDGNLERLSKKMRVTLLLSDESIECIGGCRVQSSDGRRGFDNTLNARLDLAKESARGRVAKILFDLEK
jgi:vacuolar-type H+-ATPase subunit E/Vma4